MIRLINPSRDFDVLA